MSAGARLFVISHPEVVIDPARPVPDWPLSEKGQARAGQFAATGILSRVGLICSSPEQKALQTAQIFASALGLSVNVDDALAENDRSATGFLPPLEFERAADAFFAHPRTSFRGWETAIDAQVRIIDAVRRILADHRQDDLAIVTHGAVGTLLWCACAGLPIDRRHDQPAQGHYWSARLRGLAPETGWLPIA